MSAVTISRRALVLGAASSVVVRPRRPRAAGTDTLRAKARAAGRIYGAAAQYEHLLRDRAYRARVAAECGVLVPENELKWQVLRPSKARFDFAAADWMAQFARDNGMAFRGHTLVWHQALPAWFGRSARRSNAREILIDHIMRVCRHYAGIAASWDVVNEAVDVSADGVDGLRATPWLKLLGPDYIDLAFRTAREADPEALLVYNDYGLELDAGWCDARRARVLRLLRDLRGRGTPVDALGVQSHLEPHSAPFNAEKLGSFLSDVAALGLQIIVSELDVTDRHLPPDAAVRDAAVAELYGAYTRAVLGQPGTGTLITWGLSDRYSWLNQHDAAARSDGLPVRGLPLDASLRRKPAYEALAAALAQS